MSALCDLLTPQPGGSATPSKAERSGVQPLPAPLEKVAKRTGAFRSSHPISHYTCINSSL